MELTQKIRQTDIEPHMSALQGWLRNNITGMYAGRKRKNGKKTEQWAIVMHVQQKKSPDRLALDGDTPIPPYFELPISISGGKTEMVKVPTDVVEVGAFVTKQMPQPMVSTDRVRPAPGGYQIQAQGCPLVGTLGGSITINNQYRMLSNNHILSWNGQFTHIFQPDARDPQNALADVSGFVNMVTYPTSNQQNPVYNQTDLAWCNVTQEQCAPQIQGIGVPVGFAAPAVNMQVRCFGASTDEVIQATIESIQFRTISMMLNNQYAWFQNCLLLEGEDFFPLAGDSGALLINNNMQIVGILAGWNAIAGPWGCLIPTQLIQ
ncbi:hypothetical protein [Chitinophaga deserti]|uniref:hypothetical protein n=1 Tax=Chitinophaga deserti TaxID=2164099 RepID=UPI000D6C0407|nr:hypothetical protein [Chitinophaga deserti]